MKNDHVQTRRLFDFPEHYEPRLEALLERLGYSLKKPRPLAQAVLKLSDFYLQNPKGSSPWAEAWAQAASLAYYFPLNRARAAAVAREAARLGFLEGISSLIDFGSGMGSALHAFHDQFPEHPALEKTQAFDVSQAALNLAHSLSPADRKLESFVVSSSASTKPAQVSSLATSAVMASYVLTELATAPSWWQDAEALILIEPSTQDDGRRLMQYRAELIASGHRIWGPCTHEGGCPLLENSARDWCHDRIHFDAPEWFLEIEKHLPMKNRTLTFSYLLVRKSKASPVLAPAASQDSAPQSNTQLANHQLANPHLARLVGDTLVEKGKNRQAFCRGPEREFLAWFPQRMKKGEEIHLERGNLITLESNLEKKAAELRLKSPSDVLEHDPDKVF